MKTPSHERSVRLLLGAEAAAGLMTPSVVALRVSTTLKEAASFLATSGLTAVPVVDEAGVPVGVLSQTDIVAHHRERQRIATGEAAHLERADRPSGPVKLTWTDCDVLEADSVPVEDLMTPVFHAVTPDTPAWKVVEGLLARKVHQLFVVGEDGGLLGVICTLDVLRHLRPEGEGPRGL